MATTSKDELLRSDFIKLADASGKISKVISPNPLQVGLDHEDFRSQLTAKGLIVAEQGVQVSDGAELIQAGSNISVTKNSNGSLTIAATGFADGALTATVAGGLAFDSGTTFDGSAAKTLSIDLYGNTGLNINASYGLQISLIHLANATPVLTDRLLFGDATDSMPKYCTINDILSLGSAGTLANAITIGNGLKDTGGATSYNNTAAVTLAAEAATGKGLSTSASGIEIDPSTLSSTTVATGDKVLIGDIDDSDNIKYVTAQSIANLATVGTLTSALTIGDGVQLNSGTIFDGSAARTLTAKDDGSTTSVGASGISVLKVPKSLIHGVGIQTLSYDGSAAKAVAIDRNTSGGLNFDGSDKIQLDINNLVAGGVPDTTDEIAVSYGPNSTQKIDIATLGAVATSNIVSNTVWVDGNVKAKTTSSISIDSDNRYADGVGMADSFFFVSGSVGSRGTTTRGSAVFGGDVYVSGSTYAPTLSGSLTRLPDGTSYLRAGSNVTITSESNGSITIASTGGGGGGGSIDFQSGSTTVSSVSTVDASRLGTIQDLGGGKIAITGSIGIAEDGSYVDGLFTDFNPNTPVGTAVDRFNEVLKGLAPAAAPSLDDVDSNNTGTGAKLSFGSSQSITGYTNAQPSTLSSPASNLSDVDINGTYSSTTVSNDIRSAVFAGATTIEGTLNEDISADGSNYPANSFGNGDQGTLSLYINDNASAAHTVDLSSFGSGNSLGGNGSGFIDLSAADPGHFSDGSNFDTFKHRTGSFRVSTTDQRNGWNYARVTHTVGASVTTTNYVEWVNDPDSNALTSAGDDMDTLVMTGIRKLSGARYNTGGTAEYRIRVENAYKNIYPTSNITFSTSNCSVASQAFPAIDYGSGESEAKVLHITGSATINADPILNSSISVSTNVPAVLKSSLSSVGSQTINGILLYNLSNTSTVTSETFRRENYRLISGSYNSQSDVTDVGNAWNSSLHMSGTNTGHQDGLLFYNSRLYAPRQGGVSGDFRNTADGGSITQGPDNNVNYSGITSGTRTFYRYFQNNSGGSKSNFSISINGSGNIVDQTASLTTSDIHILLKIPTTSAPFSTGWMDLAKAFATGQNADGDGCLDGSLDSSLNATNGGTFGTQSVGDNEYIMVKVEADAGWTGYISNMSITWT